MKPCPFCGETPDENDEDTFGTCDNGRHGFVRCGCGANGPTVPIDMLFKKVPTWHAWAVECWNDQLSIGEQA